MHSNHLAALIAAAFTTSLLPAQAQSLTTLFTSNNGGSSGWVVMFNATVTGANPLGLRVTAVDVNCSGTANQAVTVNVWLTPNTYLGVERVPSAWTLVSTGTAVSAARNSPTFVDVEDFILPTAGTWGIGIQTLGPGQAYTDGTGTNQAFSDLNLSLSLGSALASQFLSSGLLFNPRVWNGAIYYAGIGDAVWGTFGTGCAGSAGVPTLAAAPQNWPSVGRTFTQDISRGPATPGIAFLLFGFSKSFGAGQPLPWDLSFLGMTGCALRVEPLAQIGVPVINGTGSFGLQIPNNPGLWWLQLYSQAFVADPAANPLGFSATNGCEGVIGR